MDESQKRAPREWILIPDIYQPDSSDSRKDSGLHYVKYFPASVYEEALAELAAARKELRDHKEESNILAKMSATQQNNFSQIIRERDEARAEVKAEISLRQHLDGNMNLARRELAVVEYQLGQHKRALVVAGKVLRDALHLDAMSFAMREKFDDDLDDARKQIAAIVGEEKK